MQRTMLSRTNFLLNIKSCFGVQQLFSILLVALFYTMPSANAADLTQNDIEALCNNTELWENKTFTSGQTITPEQCMAAAEPCAEEISEQTEDSTPAINLLAGCVFSTLSIQLPSLDDDLSSGH
ncbi:hypothetical protein LDJ79_14355 [Vibrio tritonius]|uniref:Secreted protein n=1 Tax=Vibrio tritonius TaxID=1435069 RepID=A0ABS7YQP6_9VIBR|nr:hypothetical protein [Vibrio tritonius]MCA2017302.1 hypothetical protein [Vibrio tritonius]